MDKVRFYLIVLSWDFSRIILADKKNKEKGETKDEGLGLKQAKDSYTDVDDYISTYEPLLFEEIKSMIACKNVQLGATSVEQGKEDEDGFHMTAVRSVFVDDMDEGKDKEEKVNTYGLLLLSKTKIPDTKHAFALVESHNKESISLRMYLAGNCPRLAKVRSLVTSECEEDRVFYVTKICSLSTIAREYIALQSVRSLRFRDLILAPSKSNLDAEAQAWKVSGPLEEYIKNNLNESQQRSHTGRSITSKHWRLASPWLSGTNPREKTMPVNGNDGFFPITGNELKPDVVSSTCKYRVRVLVCAPSNAALDEIVLRVMNNGLRNERDRSYKPEIVRIGVKPHHSILPVFINERIREERKKRTMGDAKQDGDYAAVKAAILEEAVIVFSTLSSSDPSQFKGVRGFDVVIIDEAAQAVEPATLVPLANGCKQVFLIGDPFQLPATVTSTVAEKLGYATSMFERFKNAGYPVTMLKVQYRMHPEISKFPSQEFYAGSLKDGPNVEKQTKCSWHEYSCFGPFCFFDLHEGKEVKSRAEKSWENADEVEFVWHLYQQLVSRYPELKSSTKFAIITPYGAQIKLLKERFKSTFGVDSDEVVEITTADGCQGREKEVAIFSCVRASENKGIGFMKKSQRMNVGITRAKSSILVVGSASTLERNGEHWKNLVENAKERKCLIKVSKPYTAFFSEEYLESMRTEEEIVSSEDRQNDELDHSMTCTAGDADEVQGDDDGDGDGDD